MLRTTLAELFRVILSELVGDGRLPAEVLQIPIEISDPKNPEHGDFACNIALIASKQAGMNPRELGQMLADRLAEKYGDIVEGVEVAGPGFINLRLHAEYIAGFIGTVLLPDFKLESASRIPSPLKINVEFVSVNPNGPITIGSGRGAAYGSTLCKILEAVGHTVHREYYINDGVNSEQMRLFAESVRAIIKEQPVPERGYKGDYVYEVARRIEETLEEPTKDIQRIQEGIQKLQDEDGHSDNSLTRSTSYLKKQIWQLGLLGRLSQFSNKRQRLDLMATVELQALCEDEMIRAQYDALMAFGVHYDTWFSEQSLHISGAVASEIENMIAKGIADYEPSRVKLKLAKGHKIEDVIVESQNPAMETEDEEELRELEEETAVETEEVEEDQATLWLRSSKLGDDMDRVLRRRDGRLTYIASDVSYHKDKFNRPAGADKLITVLGPDHHGYIGRLTAVVAAMMMAMPEPGGPIEDEIESKLYKDTGEQKACEEALAKARKQLEVQIFQLVRFVKDGKPAPMRKRDGNIYALLDLMREIGTKLKPEGSEAEQLAAGKDVARFFYLMRSHDTTFDFDLDLAEKQSDENPVFYVQYAHARICSILSRALEADNTGSSPEGRWREGFAATEGGGNSDYRLLTHDREKSLIKKIVDLPDEVRRASDDYGVHRIATYGIELARTFHSFYDSCKVIQPDQPELSAARLDLCRATARTLTTTLDLLGVSAPEKM